VLVVDKKGMSSKLNSKDMGNEWVLKIGCRSEMRVGSD